MIRGIITIVIALIFTGCQSPVKNCICTTEFHTITVTVVDAQGAPVDSAKVQTVDHRTGKVYEMNQEVVPGAGNYVVFSDGYLKELSQMPATFLFKGQKGDLSFESEFLLNTDECRCHVQKISGPDTIVVSK